MLRKYILLLFLFSIFEVSAQQDTLITYEGDQLIGRLKNMERGVASFKTTYSDSDFKVKWKKIKTVNTESNYLIFIKPDKRFNGRVVQAEDNYVYLVYEADTLKKVNRRDIVYLREVKSDFLSKFSAELSVGFNFTKAQRISEFSVRSRLGYRSEHWNATAHYDDIRSTRKNTKAVERTDASINYQYILKHNWYTVSQISWYSNSEQNISLRTLGQLGIGKALLMNHVLYWGVQAGVTYNNENYKSSTDQNFNNSAEAFVGTELNIYDVEDFSLVTKLFAYPSITESKRLRLDFSLDLKYDLPLDFFIKVGYNFNHDNRPVSDAQSTDYVFQTTLGWDFN